MKLTGLKEALSGAMPVYEIPDDDLVSEVLIPAMSYADEARVAAGFFSSHCLAQLAPGLSAYVGNGGRTLRVLLSPEISKADHDAIERGVKSPELVLAEATDRLFHDARLSESALVQHTLDCLAYLVAAGRLELRFVLMQTGMYHKKQWLFRSGDDWAAVHGSGNATARGLLVNGEQMTLDRPWMDGESPAKRVERLVEQWDRQWDNRHAYSLTLTAAQGLKFASPRVSEGLVPTVRDFWEAWDRDNRAGLEPDLPPSFQAAAHILTIPDGLEWRSGPYQHQGQAVDALLAAGGRGVLAIATGGGKTRTALIAVSQMQAQSAGSVVVLVLVPSKPLMQQWAADVAGFGLVPFLPSLADASHRRRRLEEIKAALAVSQKRTEVIISSNALFAQDRSLRDFFDNLDPSVEAILIGDEMHNLGVPSFLGDPPERFTRRLGLSATPIRQYDPDGSDKLFDFFGEQVFEFSLRDAIRSGCLVPYRYFIHEVHLTDSEMDKYVDLTEQLRRSGFRVDDDGQTIVPSDKVERLLRERRAVLEQASAKVHRLRAILQDQDRRQPVRRTLIYTSAKPSVFHDMRQIDQVNGMLSDLGIVSHQFTSDETSRVDASAILERFGTGDYQVLTAMKVLDEGVDIPQTDAAFILASSTVRREWVQRRGRVLRKAPGKSVASIHDFFVIPPNPTSPTGQAIIRAELRRLREFTDDCDNEWATDGPRSLIGKYEGQGL